jgi:hypothetical protein
MPNVSGSTPLEEVQRLPLPPGALPAQGRAWKWPLHYHCVCGRGRRRRSRGHCHCRRWLWTSLPPPPPLTPAKSGFQIGLALLGCWGAPLLAIRRSESLPCKSQPIPDSPQYALGGEGSLPEPLSIYPGSNRAGGSIIQGRTF